MKKALLILVFFLVFAHANTLVKSQAGCDYVVGNSETYSEIGTNTAMDVLKQTPSGGWAGKTICLKDNKTYPVSTITKDGSSNAPLIIRSHPQNSGRATFTDTRSWPAMCGNDFNFTIKISASYVQLQGIEVSRSSGRGIAVANSLYVDIKDVVVHDTFLSGIHVEDSPNTIVDGAQTFNTTLKGEVTACITSTCPKDNPRDDTPDSVGCTIPDTVVVKNSPNSTVKNSLIRDDKSPGKGGIMLAYRSDGVTFSNNEVYNVKGNSMHIDNSDNVLYENNLIYETCSTAEKDLGNGMYFLAERGGKPEDPWTYYGSHITIRNNIIVNKRGGILFGTCQQPNTTDSCPVKDVLLENNTVVGIVSVDEPKAGIQANYALQFRKKEGNTVFELIVVRNNIFHMRKTIQPTDPHGASQVPASQITFNGNIWTKKPTFATGDVQVNDISTVISNTTGLTACPSQRISPDAFRSAAQYSGKGADVSKVGIGRGSNTPFSSPTPMPDWDFDNDHDVDVFDFNRYIKKVMTNQDSWSRLASFVAAFRSN